MCNDVGLIGRDFDSGDFKDRSDILERRLVYLCVLIEDSG